VDDIAHVQALKTMAREDRAAAAKAIQAEKVRFSGYLAHVKDLRFEERARTQSFRKMLLVRMQKVGLYRVLADRQELSNLPTQDNFDLKTEVSSIDSPLTPDRGAREGDCFG
jgi:hypothetical protein